MQKKKFCRDKNFKMKELDSIFLWRRTSCFVCLFFECGFVCFGGLRRAFKKSLLIVLNVMWNIAESDITEISSLIFVFCPLNLNNHPSTVPQTICNLSEKALAFWAGWGLLLCCKFQRWILTMQPTVKWTCLQKTMMVKEYEIEDLMTNINWNCLSYHEFVPSKSWIVWSLAFDRTIKTPALWSEILFPDPGDGTYL